MKKLPLALLAWLSLCCAVNAQVPGGGSPMVPSAPQILSCSASGCVFAPNGPFAFNGADGSIQFATGSTLNAAEYFQALGGIAGGGASLLARNAAQTGNVSANITAQGAANVVYGNSGHGTLGVLLDPGSAVSNPVQMTPSTSGTSPVKVGNATGGINLDCGSNANCQFGGTPIGAHDVQSFLAGGSFTWTRATGVTWVRARGCGGGGAGGSGALTASATAASGGGGGAGGGCFDETYRASDLAATEPVNIGAGGVSVAAQTTSSTAGLNGSAGGYSCFGGTTPGNSIDCGGGGGGGAGGQINATSGGGGGGAINGSGTSSTGATGGSGAFGVAASGGTGTSGSFSTGVGLPGPGAGSSAVGVGAPGAGAIDGCAGGGSGGGVSAAPASNNGGSGGNAFRAYKLASPPAGGTSGTPAGGSITPQLATFPGFGGGGGYGNASGASGAGGAGTQCGGGGGGGSALNGSTAGASGKGGDGWMVVTSW